MPLPSNISKEHVLQAIDKIDKEGLPSKGKSQYYDLVYNNRRYPPKMVVSFSNIYANGKPLERSSFTGGRETPSFELLKRLGFTIEEKPTGYFEELQKFLSQAKSGDLKTKHFLQSYRGLKVKVSFGQGVSAQIPWISFLEPPNTTADGIYPVYLYYKEVEKLILSYGISETNEPKRSWNLKNPTTINKYFVDHDLGRPKRYGDSFLFKVYDVKDLPNAKVMDQDLNEIINAYKDITGTAYQDKEERNKQDLFDSTLSEPSISQKDMDIQSFQESLEGAGLIYSNRLVTRFISSLATKPFVLLTGLSGSGKTKLAQAFAQWICEDENQYCIVPVGADWTNREPLLGYPNALKPEEYVKPDNGVLDLIIDASKNPELPFFLILDEMNLSHVERYFADFLSAMESKEKIPLFAEGTVNNGVPERIALPPNLFILGTVNIDETTNMFSPKVLDRANTIEFRVTKEEITKFLNNMADINMSALTTKGASMASSFLQLARSRNFKNVDSAETNKTLVDFFDQLRKTGAEFGYRSASEILRLINQLSVLDDNLTSHEKLDIAIMQKLLPKLHGSRRKLCPILVTLGRFCVTDQIKNIEKDVFVQDDFNFEDRVFVKYPLALEKITRMHKGAVDNGFASFAEA